MKNTNEQIELPSPVTLSMDGPPIIACGADLKNRVHVTRNCEAFPGEDLDDLRDYRNYQSFVESIRHLCEAAQVEPEIITHDMHPDFVSTHYALDSNCATKVAVQHHHAHVAATMVEHGITSTVIGVAMDGTGYGTDGTVWGGEFLVANLAGFTRAAHLKQYRMPGADQAILRPDRMAYSMLISELDGIDTRLLPELTSSDRQILDDMLNSGFRSPLTSSAGRLFDAVSALTGICTTATFPGEPAISLEQAAAKGVTDSYDHDLSDTSPLVLSFGPAIRAIAADKLAGADAGIISARFHNTVINGIHAACSKIRKLHGLEHVVLSGGVFFNKILTSGVTDVLQADGFTVYNSRLISPGDSSIAIGQAAIALAGLKQDA